MKKVLKSISALLFAVVLTLSITEVTQAYSGAEEENIVVDGSRLTHEQKSEVTLSNPQRGNILNQGTASIGDNGGGSVNVYGAVFGSVVCDKLTLNMTLQRYSNGSWVNVKSFSDSAYNKALLTKSYNVSVTKGYYYRVKAACTAKKGSTTESQAPVTDGIWID